MSAGSERQSAFDPSEDSIDGAFARSIYELQLLANFYHRHGFMKPAQDIYRTLLKVKAAHHALGSRE